MAETPPRSEAAIVVALRAAGCVFAEDEAALLIAEACTPGELDRMIERRIEGEPLEVILGWAEFRGLRVAVEAGVFVPRQRTAFLVDLAVELTSPGTTAIDLCCGSGALGLALASTVPELTLFATDIEPAAVACARTNLAGVGEVFEGDLFDPLPTWIRGTVGVILANAPYVPSAAVPMMPPEARDHEPWSALDGGDDGLAIHRRIADAASTWLAHRGALLIETSEEQAPIAAQLFRDAGLHPHIARSDDDDATVVIGKLA